MHNRDRFLQLFTAFGNVTQGLIALPRAYIARMAEMDDETPRTALDESALLASKAQHIERLTVDDKLVARKKPTRLSTKRERVEDVIQEEKSYYVKKKQATVDDGAVELETYAGALCELLVGSELVRAPRGYHNAVNYVLVASPFIKDCKTYFAAPLRKNDLTISVLAATSLRASIIGNIQDLVETMHAEIKESLLSGLSRRISGLFVQRPMDAKEFLARLNDYLQDDPFSDDALRQLNWDIKQRLAYLALHPHPAEQEQLQQILADVHAYFTRDNDQREDLITVAELDMIAQQLQRDRVDLGKMASIRVEVAKGHLEIPALDLINYRRLRGLAHSLMSLYLLKEADCNSSNFTQNGEIFDFGMTKYNIGYYLKNQHVVAKLLQRPYEDTFQCTRRDVRMFPYLRDARPYYWPTQQTKLTMILTSVVQRYINDFALSEQGDIVTKRITEMMNQMIMMVLQYQAQHAPLLTRLSQGVYQILVRVKAEMIGKNPDEVLLAEQRAEIVKFIQTMATLYIEEHRQEIEEWLTQIDDKEAWFEDVTGVKVKRFAKEDNELFRAMATHPVMQFHKFKPMLKYLLLDGDFIRAFAALYITPERTFVEDFARARLLDVVVDDEVKRIAEVRGVLIKMPEFHAFLVEHGKSVMEDIRVEWLAVRDELLRKDNGDYEELLARFDWHAMEQRFHELRASVMDPADAPRDDTVNVSRLA